MWAWIPIVGMYHWCCGKDGRTTLRILCLFVLSAARTAPFIEQAFLRSKILAKKVLGAIPRRGLAFARPQVVAMHRDWTCPRHSSIVSRNRCSPIWCKWNNWNDRIPRCLRLFVFVREKSWQILVGRIVSIGVVPIVLQIVPCSRPWREIDSWPQNRMRIVVERDALYHQRTR